MVETLLHALLVQTVALSLSAVAVHTVQALVVRRFGAGAGYLCWLLVPVAMVAVALPHSETDALVVRVDVAAVAPGWMATSAPAASGAGVSVAVALAAAWVAGALVLTFVLARRQSRFDDSISRTDGAAPRLPAGSGPAVLGLLRPRIALPKDFLTAYDRGERRLMLLHEAVHLRRRDNLWNLLASVLLVAHWFNPIAWWAARRARADQETSCDAAVLRGAPARAFATYAGALLKVQGVALAPPLATSWQSVHPLVERVRMLQAHRISSGRHRNGRRLAMLLIVLGAISGYAVRSNAGAQAAEASSILTDVELKELSADGSKTTTISARLLSRDGRKVSVRFDARGAKAGLVATTEVGLTATRLEGRTLQLDVTLLRGEPSAAPSSDRLVTIEGSEATLRPADALIQLSSPRVITIDGTPARVEVSSKDGGYHLVLTLVPRIVQGDLVMTPTTNDLRKYE